MPDNAEYMSMATAELTDLNNALNIANNALANLGLGPLAYDRRNIAVNCSGST